MVSRFFERNSISILSLVRFSVAIAMIGCVGSLGLAQQNRPPGRQQDNMMQVVAMVNGQQVTRQKLANECVKRYGEQVIESIIKKRLVYNKLLEQQITITERDVNEEIDRQAKKLNMKTQDFLNYIVTERKISIDRVKNDIYWMELALQRLAENQIQVSEQEIQSELESEYGEKVLVRYMALKDRQTADQIRAQLQQTPEEFERLTMKHSLDKNSASKRGLLPPLARNIGDPKLEAAAFALKPGEISPVISYGDPQIPAEQRHYCIIRCVQKYPAVELAQTQLAAAREAAIGRIKNDKLRGAAVAMFKEMQAKVKVVNVYNDPNLSKQNPGVAATVDGKPITMRYLSEECIARFGVEVLDLEINRTLLRQALQKTGKSVLPADTQAEINKAARDWGFVKDGRVDIDRWLNSQTGGDASKIPIYIEDVVWPSVALRKMVESTVEVKQEDMQKGFEANFGEKVDVLAVIVSDARTANEVWKMATANPTEKFFGELANQYSTDIQAKNNFGKVQPIPMHGGFPALETEAFKLNPGEVSAVVQMEGSWIILYCRGRTQPVTNDYDAVKQDLHDSILNRKTLIAMNEYFGLLRSSAHIDNFLTGTSQTGRAMIENAKQQQGNGSRIK